MKILIAFILFLIVIAYTNPARQYWSKVGFEMDKTLNPCKYNLCERVEM